MIEVSKENVYYKLKPKSQQQKRNYPYCQNDLNTLKIPNLPKYIFIQLFHKLHI